MLDLYGNIVDASPDCVALWMRRTNGCKCEAIAIFFLAPSRAISFRGDDKWPPVQNCPQTDLLLPASICGLDQIGLIYLWAWSDQSVCLRAIRSDLSDLPPFSMRLRFIVLCRCVLETKEEHTATQIVSYLRLQLGLKPTRIHYHNVTKDLICHLVFCSKLRTVGVTHDYQSFFV